MLHLCEKHLCKVFFFFSQMLPCLLYNDVMMIGNKRALDVSSVVQGETKFFSVLMLTWGK